MLGFFFAANTDITDSAIDHKPEIEVHRFTRLWLDATQPLSRDPDKET
jgi:hypothetical protein